MTKEQLLAMPSSDYMNPEQLEFFQSLLEKTKSELLSATQECRVSLATFEKPADQADMASVEETRMEVGRTIERLNIRQRSIDKALAAIRSGDYGFCHDFGTEISLGRLLTQPTALLSVEAQSYREQMGRHVAA